MKAQAQPLVPRPRAEMAGAACGVGDPANAVPLLLGRAQAHRVCGVSRATWDRLTATGLNPAPVRLGGRVLWRAAELAEWTAAGCPPRNEWETLKKASERPR